MLMVDENQVAMVRIFEHFFYLQNINQMKKIYYVYYRQAWASAGEGKRGHLPPPPLADQNSMFLPPPGKKSAGAQADR